MLPTLKNTALKDIFQTGFIELENGIAEMTTMNRFVFLLLDDMLLKLESSEQYSRLLIQKVEELEWNFEIEEEMIPATNSIAEVVLTDTMADNRIERIELFGVRETEDIVNCAAMAIHLYCGQQIFFDPSFFFGINIGGEMQRAVWFDNLRDEQVDERKTTFV